VQRQVQITAAANHFTGADKPGYVSRIDPDANSSAVGARIPIFGGGAVFKLPIPISAEVKEFEDEQGIRPLLAQRTMSLP
jgi:hypothetical protein